MPLSADTVSLTDKLSASLGPVPSQQGPTARSLLIKVPTISSDETNADVLDVFGLYRDLVSLPVLEKDHPIGLISRNSTKKFFLPAFTPRHCKFWRKLERLRNRL